MSENIKKILKSTALLLALIIISALLVRYFSGSETLSEYAKNNPSPKDSSESPLSEEENNISLPKDGESLSFSDKTESAVPPDRTTYKEGFYFEPLNSDIIDRITGCSFPALDEGETIEISYDDLSYVSVLYIGFDLESHQGEIICNKAIAEDLVEIFYELYHNEYQIEEISLIEAYDGDDLASCSANNTSCFNYRKVVGSASLSKHALGLAIDINPFYNPYITYNKDGSENIYPAEASEYADRTRSFAYKIDENDLCYKLFTEHGFTWGGHWNSCKDYQHFQKSIE